MYVTYGNQSYLEDPTETYYQDRGEPIFGHGVGTFISKQEVSAGDQIRVYIFSGANITATFSSRVLTQDGMTKIEIGQSFLGFASFQEDKIYFLNLTEELLKKANNDNSSTEDNSQYDLSITIITYSGSPDFQVSFSDKFE